MIQSCRKLVTNLVLKFTFLNFYTSVTLLLIYCHIVQTVKFNMQLGNFDCIMKVHRSVV